MPRNCKEIVDEYKLMFKGFLTLRPDSLFNEAECHDKAELLLQWASNARHYNRLDWWSFPHSWLIIGFVTRSTRRVPPVEQELLSFRGTWVHHQLFSEVRVTRSLVLYVCFVDRCLSFCIFLIWPLWCLFFDLRILITPLVSSISSHFNLIFKWSKIAFLKLSFTYENKF